MCLFKFSHNDSHAPELPESTGAAMDYQEYPWRYIDEARASGAMPILVTPLVRRTFDAVGNLTDALPPHANAMKEVGEDKKAPVVDLHASSFGLMEQLGPEGCAGLANPEGEVTHFNEKGAPAMADLLIRGFNAATGLHFDGSRARRFLPATLPPSPRPTPDRATSCLGPPPASTTATTRSLSTQSEPAR